ncbi:MAG TPA: type II toxin-antitoxin system HipA family toxin [Bryobacteraceae bacterium]|nr:type II toxin-antitoxin system HipA family toxin [Bryobacteraceae bacterium]
MPLHLVGETIDKTRSHYRAETGDLVQLMRGIYVDAADDADAMVLRHAVRIARYLYPSAYLSAASAILLGPTRDGRLFLSGRRRQRTRIRGLEIVRNEGPEHPSLTVAALDDGMGEFDVEISSVAQRFLEAFRARSEHAASMQDAMREATAARLIEEHGSPKAAADAVWALARKNHWNREAESAERFLLRRPPPAEVRNDAALRLTVAWHGAPVGHLTHDGFEWRWAEAESGGPPLIRQTTPGRLPPLIASLLPEGWLETVLKNRDERETLRSGKRYLSNLTVVERLSELAALPPDVLLTPLARYMKDGTFTGRYAGPGKHDLETSFAGSLARIYDRGDTPRLSGIQIKAPMFLDSDGTLSPAAGRPFTHILKPAGAAGFETLPAIEWLALGLGRAVGFRVPCAALVPMPDGMPPALIVERFDIRTTVDDKRLIALEDLGSVLGLDAAAKYKSTMERVARAVRPLSTAPDEDAETVIRRALFAWLIADGDMHLKNLALLKIAEPGAPRFHEVRIAPLYDAVTTRIFPGLHSDHMALKVNGKDDRLRRADFRALAGIAGLKASAAESAIDETVAQLGQAVDRTALPRLPDSGREAGSMAEKMFELVRSRLTPFA